MKKFVSFIISITIFLSCLPVHAKDSIPTVDYPAEGAELGYLFSLASEPDADFNADDYEGIELVSEMANIYYADTIEHIKAIENIVNIDIVAENWSLEQPEPPIDDDTSVSLFFIDDELSLNEENELTSDEEDTNDTDENNISYPNDPLLERQWYYEAVKGYTFRNNGITGEGVKVGIIDSGLTKEFKTFYDFEGVDIQTGINICAMIDKNEELLYDTEDNQTHGTGVASIICSKTDNNFGIAGLMDSCTFIPYKVEDSRCSAFANSGYSLIVAMEEAYNDNCDVVNISRAGELTYQSQIDLENSVVNKSEQNGMIIVAGTGNDGRTTNKLQYPAACDNVIGVGSVEPTCDREDAVIDATTEMIKPESEYTADDTFFTGWLKRTVQNLSDNAYKKTETSTANESVFVCAPGSGMTLACPSERISKNFNISSGTSFATPIVASAAIGVKQMRPYVDVDMFREILIATAVDLEDEGYDINTGYGMVNFERIYDYVSQMPLTAPERTPEVTIDYENEQLAGFPIDREYTVNGEAVILNGDYTLPIKEEWFGTTVEIVKKASSESYEDSEPQMLDIPARPDLPETVYGTETGIANDNGDVIGYMPANGGEWSQSNVFLSLPTGMYLVKSESTETAFSSSVKEIYVGRQNVGVEIDYKNEMLIGFEDGKNYIINGQEAEISADSTYPINASWFGTDILIIRKASNDNDMDMTEELSIPERPAAPSGLSGDRGKIIGTSADMEYSKQGEQTWNSCSDNITQLASPSGIYQVRIKQSGNGFAGEAAVVQVGLPVTEIDIDYKNETLKNFEAGETYTINGENVKINNQTCTISEEWFGTTVSIVRKASDNYINDSEPQMLDIPARTAAPMIDLLDDNTVNLPSNILFKEENADNWQTNASDEAITLEPGKTYVFKVQYTDNSFASETRLITVQFVQQYDIETGIAYDPDSGECTYSAVNKTERDINAAGIIAVYAQNGALKHLETIDVFSVGKNDKKLNFTLSDGDTVKWLVWDSLQSMQPKDNVKLSEYTAAFGDAE